MRILDWIRGDQSTSRTQDRCQGDDHPGRRNPRTIRRYRVTTDKSGRIVVSGFSARTHCAKDTQ